MRLYHMSPVCFYVLRVAKSLSARKKVWMCQEEHLERYFEHLRKHHGTNMRYLYSVEISMDRVSVYSPGIYVSYKDVYPCACEKIVVDEDGILGNGKTLWNLLN